VDLLVSALRSAEQNTVDKTPPPMTADHDSAVSLDVIAFFSVSLRVSGVLILAVIVWGSRDRIIHAFILKGNVLRRL
jgi:hypothetical protein